MVSLVSDAEDGVHRGSALTVTPFDLPDGCVGGYYPEMNPLVALSHHDKQSKTPATKSVPVRMGCVVRRTDCLRGRPYFKRRMHADLPSRRQYDCRAAAGTLGAVPVFGGRACLPDLRSPYSTNQDVTRDQPVPFSHEHHVGGLGLDCRYCHTSVEKARFAGCRRPKPA